MLLDAHKKERIMKVMMARNRTYLEHFPRWSDTLHLKNVLLIQRNVCVQRLIHQMHSHSACFAGRTIKSKIDGTLSFKEGRARSGSWRSQTQRQTKVRHRGLNIYPNSIFQPALSSKSRVSSHIIPRPKLLYELSSNCISDANRR